MEADPRVGYHKPPHSHRMFHTARFQHIEPSMPFIANLDILDDGPCGRRSTKHAFPSPLARLLEQAGHQNGDSRLPQNDRSPNHHRLDVERGAAGEEAANRIDNND
jgi:hypothetical protein